MNQMILIISTHPLAKATLNDIIEPNKGAREDEQDVACIDDKRVTLVR
jgi:hypothetical protein